MRIRDSSLSYNRILDLYTNDSREKLREGNILPEKDIAFRFI